MFYINTLTIAGSDSSGGAGIQADIKTMSALGCYAASVITSVTAQNTKGVYAIQQITPDVIASQIHAVMNDLHPKAVKIGMVNDAETIRVITDVLSEYDIEHLVVDPVMVSTSGSRLMKDNAVEEFCNRLLPMATLLTPNIPETEVLSGICIKSEKDIDAATKVIIDKGCNALLIKGGHIEGEEKTDRLYMKDRSCTVFRSRTVETRNTHGTGCTLSSAITAFLACGEKLTDAVRLAKKYVTDAIISGSDVNIGDGYGPVNHFHNPKKLIKI